MPLCINCDLTYKELQNGICVFCDIVKINKKDYLFHCVIGETKLSQLEIIKKTYEFFMKNDNIPFPYEIDNNVNILKVNPYLYRINNDIKTKIFFTNCIDLNKIKAKRFPLKYNQQNLNINYIQQNELK
jgi:hypothetical protein